LNLGLARVLPDEQRLFFDVIAQCRDAWDCAFRCGSCSIQRRQAIEAAGGVPTDSTTEDILSTLVLLRKGYITRYLNERLSMGLAAESIGGYFTQRTRWCRGALQTLFLKSGPLGPGLSLLQRIFFFPLDWLVQYPVRMVAMVVPIVFLWTGVGPFQIGSLEELLSHQLPAYVALAATMRLFAPNCYIPILSTATSFFGSLRLVPTILATLVKPFGAPFRVTPKGNNNDASAGDRATFLAVVSLAALTLGGLIANRIWPDRIPGGRAASIVAEFYALANLIVLALAAAMALEMPRPRRAERFPVRRRGSYRVEAAEHDLPCVLLEISETGALLGDLKSVIPGAALELEIDGVGTIRARAVRRAGPNLAIEFCPISDAERGRINEFIYSSGLSNAVMGLSIPRVIARLFSFLFGLERAAVRSRPQKYLARRMRHARIRVSLENR
jgi:cellulose synthase (UDP-forming)